MYCCIKQKFKKLSFSINIRDSPRFEKWQGAAVRKGHFLDSSGRILNSYERFLDTYGHFF